MTIPAMLGPAGPRIPRPAATPATGATDADFEETMRRALLAVLDVAAAIPRETPIASVTPPSPPGSSAETPMVEGSTASTPETETETRAETETRSPEPGPLPGRGVSDDSPTTTPPAPVIVEHQGSSRGPSSSSPIATDPRAFGFTRTDAPASSPANVAARPPTKRSASGIGSGPPGDNTTHVVHARVVKEGPAIRFLKTMIPSDDLDPEAPERSRDLHGLDTFPQDGFRTGPAPLDQSTIGETEHGESPRSTPPQAPALHPEGAPRSPDRMTLVSHFPQPGSPGEGTPQQGGLDTTVLPGSLPGTTTRAEHQQLTVDRLPAEALPLDGPSSPRSEPHPTASQPPGRELSLSTARAAIAAWWEGLGSPREGRAPSGSVQPAIEPAQMVISPVPPPSPRFGMVTPSVPGSDAIAGASSRPQRAPIADDQTQRENLRLVIRDVAHDPTTGTGIPPVSVPPTAPKGVATETVLPSVSRATTAPVAFAPQGTTGGEQMALTLRQDDGTAVTIRVMVRGDRVEATIIDRGPPQAPVGSRETGALHLALERQGFRDIHVAVQHLAPLEREHLTPAPESRRTTDSTQDRNQHARRQDDEGAHSQGRSHQRSPRERER